MTQVDRRGSKERDYNVEHFRISGIVNLNDGNPVGDTLNKGVTCAGQVNYVSIWKQRYHIMVPVKHTACVYRILV